MMPFAKPRTEERWQVEWARAAGLIGEEAEQASWQSDWSEAPNGQSMLQQTSSSGASVAISGGIGVDGLLALKERLQLASRESEPRLRMMLAIDDLLGVYDDSPVARRQQEHFDDLVWLIDESGFYERVS
jgi:hypothetical protein